MANKDIVLRARCIKRITKANNDWGIYLMEAQFSESFPDEVKRTQKANSKTLTVYASGNDFPLINVWADYHGNWVKMANKNTYRFAVSAYELSYESVNSTNAVLNLLKCIKGVGTVTARSISEYFGKQTINVLDSDPSRLKEINFSDKKIEDITKSWKSMSTVRNLVRLLGKYDIPMSTIKRIAVDHGFYAADEVEYDPYILIPYTGFSKAEEVARDLGVDLISYRRIRGAALYVLNDEMKRKADMYVTWETFRDRTIELLNGGAPQKVGVEHLIKAVRRMQVKGERCIVVRNDENGNPGNIFPVNNDIMESYESNVIKAALNVECVTTEQDVEAALQKLHEAGKIEREPAVGQKAAIINCLTHNVSVLTGGPGTGKTTTLNTLIQCYELLYPEKTVTLLAPTGKAARRMSQATHHDASTIHSSLHLYDMTSLNFEVKKPKEGLIVVDESSMIDTFLMYALCKTIDNGNYRLLLVGDTDQLPSVGAGCILNDIINSHRIPTSRLTEIFRQRGADGKPVKNSITENAYKVNSGKMDLMYDSQFQLINVKDSDEASKVIIDLYKEQVEKFGMDQTVVLCPRRKNAADGRYKTCSDALNVNLQNVMNPAEETTGKVTSVIVGGREFRLNDRVMQWKNTSYASNGEVGVITELFVDPIKIKVKFENGNETVLGVEQIEDLSLSYAMSIHKSQGSEYNSVIIPLLSSDICELYKRNLLYTAITRSKKVVYIVGDENAINSCINRNDATVRNTLFKSRLCAQ